MRLYLVQHAESMAESEDPERPLTDRGRRDIQRVAAFVGANLQVNVREVFHSGKTRAQQTAEILAQHVNMEEAMQVDENLAPMADPHIWNDRLAESRNSLMLVGHLPHLNRLASLLLCGDAAKTIVKFQMGGIVSLERESPEQWSIEWMVTPQILS